MSVNNIRRPRKGGGRWQSDTARAGQAASDRVGRHVTPDTLRGGDGPSGPT